MGKNKNEFHSLSLVLAILMLWSGPAIASSPYTVRDLGTLGGTASQAGGINNVGQVVGSSLTLGDVDWHAFLYSEGSMHDLGTLMEVGSSFGHGINDAAQVVGSSATSDVPSAPVSHAFLYSGGSMTDLGTLGGTESFALGINNAGQVVGYSGTYVPHYQAFLYSEGSMTGLGTLPGYPASMGYGINDTGQVVGFSYDPSHVVSRAFLYSGGIMHDLGTLGGIQSFAFGINNAGQVVGHSHPSGDSYWHAFLYSDGIMHDLGTLGGAESQAWDINNLGQVVGSSQTSDDPNEWHAFLYSDGIMTDLNSFLDAASGWILLDAKAINDKGQILGNGDYNGTRRAFLMTPVTVRQICSRLGGGKIGKLDLDVFKFNGAKREQVTIRLAADPTGESSGQNAALTVIGPLMFKRDASPGLPNELVITLPRSGSYQISVGNVIVPKPRFVGGYCLTVESSANAWQTLQPFASVE